MSKSHFIALIESAVKNKASDIHLREGEKPSFRIKGDLVSVNTSTYEHNSITEVIKILMGSNSYDLKKLKEMDGSFEVEDLCRVRFNILKFQSKFAVILRIISLNVPTIESLGLPSQLKKIAQAKNGLILVTGATGSGKTSTLNAIIDYINKNRFCHVLTLEDPVEFIHKSINSKITQRDIGLDTDNFEDALKYSLRQDPDIILIGEMRDPLTVTTAIKAAETGHLVLGTVHTTNALSTIGRLISMFPTNEQNNVRERIADNLHSTISQRLIKKRDDIGMCAALEIMVVTPGVSEAIKKPEKAHEIYTYINKGSGGMQSFDQHLTELYKLKVISLDEAKANATSADDFERNLIFERNT
ncbi:MAG: PilT/PilU family type 4a pilus ATPase [Bacteriovoracaceae bacterium]|jgi:twitching motility protein PilT|nr:PilT/PilU family type 4a pilus ATPase [Bacteriovoracaceae bacterium]